MPGSLCTSSHVLFYFGSPFFFLGVVINTSTLSGPMYSDKTKYKRVLIIPDRLLYLGFDNINDNMCLCSLVHVCIDFPFFFFCSRYVSCEFDKFRVDAHLCKLRATLAARFHQFVIL